MLRIAFLKFQMRQNSSICFTRDWENPVSKVSDNLDTGGNYERDCFINSPACRCDLLFVDGFQNLGAAPDGRFGE